MRRCPANTRSGDSGALLIKGTIEGQDGVTVEGRPGLVASQGPASRVAVKRGERQLQGDREGGSVSASGENCPVASRATVPGNAGFFLLLFFL